MGKGSLSVTACKQRRLPFLPAHLLSCCPETGEIVKPNLLNNTSSVICCSWFSSVWWLLRVTEVLLAPPCARPQHCPLGPNCWLGVWALAAPFLPSDLAGSSTTDIMPVKIAAAEVTLTLSLTCGCGLRAFLCSAVRA